MTDLEIPFERNRHGHYRFFEILPGVLSWSLLLLPLILSFVDVTAAVFFILGYLLIFFVRSLGYDFRALAGHRTMKQHMKLDWIGLAADLQAGEVTGKDIVRPKWHLANLKRLQAKPTGYHPDDLLHAVVLATVNEGREVLEPTIQAILASDYDTKKIILVIAYEARAGRPAEERVHELLELYGPRFHHAMAVKHPASRPGEVIGKGSNITYAARELQKYVERSGLDTNRVLVTSLDADNRPDKRYFAALSYLYCVVPDPLKASYLPLEMFSNNIWDAPTLMRIIATGNSIFYIVGSQRPHLARNFSAHAQALGPLIDMDFWSTRTIVEDGHQFWRSYFHFDGDYRVYPLSVPIYQDAVLADGYWRSCKAQFYQLRRWTYGASDIAYIAHMGFFRKNKVSKLNVLGKFLRTLESHVTWATGALLVLGAAFIPPLIHPQSLAANELPLIVSKIQRIGILGLLVLAYVCLLTLPPRPARHKRHRSLLMAVQWVLLPVTGICFASLAALNSQTRLIFKRYLTKFDVTEHAVVTTEGQTVSTIADPDRVIKKRRSIFGRHRNIQS